MQMLIMAHNNLGIAYNQEGAIFDSIHHHQISLGYLQQIISTQEAHDDKSHLKHASEITNIYAHIHRARRAVCDWFNWETSIQELVLRMNLYGGTALLPFDTLALPVAPEWKRKVARLHSSHFDRLYNKIPTDSADFRNEAERYGDAASPLYGTVCTAFQDEVVV